ncbi:MAG: hypothetical protein U9Q80_00030 [Bacillota bacterium]|nr:hypothetical protein [Bacillota bacterium]
MKFIKGLFVTITFTIVLLIVILLVVILMIYSPNAELPDDYKYIEDSSMMNVDQYFRDFDFGSLDDIRIGEREINIVIATYLEYEEIDNEDIDIHYVYVDLKENQFDAVAHLTISEVMEFPMKIKVISNVGYSDEILYVEIKKIKAGLVTIPNWVMKFALKTNGVESAYLNIDRLEIVLDTEEMNPYRNFIEVKNVLIDDDSLHVKIGLTEILNDSIKGIVTTVAETAKDTIEEMYGRLADDEKKSADIILDFIDDNPNSNVDNIDIEQAKNVSEEFMSLSAEAQDTIVDNIQNSLSSEEMNELKKIIEELMR